MPADLGFYDLRLAESREAQAALARDHGIDAFCYYHYWFAGRRILERPFNEVLASGKPDFPFLLCWANESWTGVWHGLPGKKLIEQTYPGIDDFVAYFQALLPAFRDKRYLTVDGKPMFLIWKPQQLPDARHYGRHNVCSHGDFVGKTPYELARYAFVSGHFGFDFAKSLMVGRYSFTFLRSPIERVLSFYYFCHTRDPQELPIYKIAQEHDLDSFLRLVHEHQVVRNSIWNGQTWRLSGGPGMPNVSADDLPPEQMLARSIENLDSFSFVGFTETFDDDVNVIMRGLRMPNALRPGRENVTHGRPLARDHSRQTIKLIEEMTELDQALYDAAWRRRRPH